MALCGDVELYDYLTVRLCGCVTCFMTGLLCGDVARLCGLVWGTMTMWLGGCVGAIWRYGCVAVSFGCYLPCDIVNETVWLCDGVYMWLMND